MNNYISSLSSGKKSSKKMKNTPEELLSQAYTDTTAVTLGSRKVCPAELNLYFAEEYFDYIEDPSNADYLDELLAIDSFSDLATMKHGRKRETWREFFLDRAVKTLQRSLALAKFAVENKLPFSEDKLLSPAAIQEAENRFLRSSPSCFGVPSSYINGYVEINGLASLSLDYLQKEYNKQQHPDSFNSFVTSKILQYYYLSTTTYTPFAKIVGLSSSDF